MLKEETFKVTNKTRSALPMGSASFEPIKEAVMGKKYNLSLVFVDRKTSKKLNSIYRSKDEPTDILSFGIAENEGEILINPEIARKKAMMHERTFKNYLKFLFIHGLFHLKGMDHGLIMEKAEEKIRRKFKV